MDGCYCMEFPVPRRGVLFTEYIASFFVYLDFIIHSEDIHLLFLLAFYTLLILFVYILGRNGSTEYSSTHPIYIYRTRVYIILCNTCVRLHRLKFSSSSRYKVEKLSSPIHRIVPLPYAYSPAPHFPQDGRLSIQTFHRIAAASKIFHPCQLHVIHVGEFSSYH